MKRLNFLFISIIFISLLHTSCIEDDFTTSSSDLLKFSTDTVAFDTIFTDVGTPTKKFVVHNTHKKMINISSIRIKGDSDGKFYLNVDGQKGDSFQNIEIRGEDSIFVFVEAYIDPTDRNNPIEIKDKIEFLTNGVEQNVVLTAWGQDVIRKRGEIITENTVLTAEKPYLIFDSLVVEKDATLTIDPGTVIYFHDKAKLTLRGRMLANGTQEMPVTMRGDRLDKVVGDISYDLMSGQWGGIDIAESSYENEMRYFLMRGSTTGVSIDSCNTDRRKLYVFNSVLHNSSNSVLKSAHAWIEAEGTEFSDAKDAVVDLTGGRVSFINCTLTNYYLFSAISGKILTLNYLLPAQKEELPLMTANFDNCIIFGNAGDISVGDLTGSSVYLRSCLLKSSGNNDDNFIGCIWKGDPKFYTVREDYIFDYRLRNKSDAIAEGDRTLTPERLALDRYGVNRFESEGIDIGAYVWVPAAEDTEK